MIYLTPASSVSPKPSVLNHAWRPNFETQPKPNFELLLLLLLSSHFLFFISLPLFPSLSFISIFFPRAHLHIQPMLLPLPPYPCLRLSRPCRDSQIPIPIPLLHSLTAIINVQPLSLSISLPSVDLPLSFDLHSWYFEHWVLLVGSRGIELWLFLGLNLLMWALSWV